MSRKYCVIKENQMMRALLSIIKSHYISDNKASLQEVNLEHVLNNIDNLDIRTVVKNAWHDLQITIGSEIRLLENNCKKSFINFIEFGIYQGHWGTGGLCRGLLA